MASEHVVLVTGAAGGIGSEVVRILLEDLAACVVATDIVIGEKLEQLGKQYQERLEVAATSETSVAAAVKRFGRLTGVCLNAGVMGPCYRLDSAPVDKWEKACAINVFSHLHTLKYALPELRKTKGRITATTSGAGYAPLFSGWGFYGMSKAAVGFLIRQVALEERDNGIIAVGISPGLCDTKMVDGLMEGTHDGWGEEESRQYQKFASGIDLITPTTAGNVYAQTVTKGDASLSGLVLDYDDSRLPIPEASKRKVTANYDYTKHTVES